MDLLADDGALPELQVNEKFANDYETRKKQEELSRLREEYGEDYNESEDESSIYSSEDSDAELVTPQVEVAILKTMQMIRQGDPLIYESGVDVFSKTQGELLDAPATKSKAKHEKVVKMKDMERNLLLGKIKDTRPTPAQEQELLQEETIAAFHAENSDDELLTLRTPNQTEDPEEDAVSYKKFIESQIGKKELKRIMRQPAQTSTDNLVPSSKLDDDFLLNYIMNRGWKEKKIQRIPTHQEITEPVQITQPSGANAVSAGALATGHAYKALEPIDDDSDAEFEDRNEEFEVKYNFRFEESGGADLITHSRQPDESVRRTDDSRKQARDALKQRKEVEKAERKADLARLKTLKRSEITEKLRKIREAAALLDANEEEDFDLEADFDEEQHQKQMQAMFGEDWYAQADEEKPVWDDDIDITDIVPETVGEDAEIEEEAYDPSQSVPKPKKKSKKDKKKKSKKAGGVEEGEDEAADTADQALEINDEERAKIANELEEYYKLDYEDTIGDLKTRFKYVDVPSADSELTPADILMLTDKELNSYVSLKKLAPFRTDGDAMKRHTKKKKLRELKSALSSRKWGDNLPGKKSQVDLEIFNPPATKKRKAEDEPGESTKPRKRVGRKERQRMRADDENGGQAEPSVATEQ